MMKDPKKIADRWAKHEMNPDGYYPMSEAISDEAPVMAGWSEEQIKSFLELHAKAYEQGFRKELAKAKKEIAQARRDEEDE
jgi:hypothetical protein